MFLNKITLKGMIDRIVPAALCEALYMLKYLQTVK